MNFLMPYRVSTFLIRNKSAQKSLTSHLIAPHTNPDIAKLLILWFLELSPERTVYSHFSICLRSLHPRTLPSVVKLPHFDFPPIVPPFASPNLTMRPMA